MKDSKIDILQYVGQTFDRLLVVKFLHFKEYTKSRQPIYECKCDCGKTVEAGLWNLKKASISSCGCYFSELNSLKDGVASFNALFGIYKASAKKRGYSFSLNKDTFKKIVDSDCRYCGGKPSNIQTTNNNTGSYIYNGIDRQDNSIGYEEGNCVPCCIICNRAKSILSLDEFEDWINRLVKNNNPI